MNDFNSMGINMIQAQRNKAFDKGWTIENDAENYKPNDLANMAIFLLTNDRRFVYKRLSKEYIEKLALKSNIDQLAIAGQFIAAELDRYFYIENRAYREKQFSDRYDELLSMGFTFDSEHGFVFYGKKKQPFYILAESSVRILTPGDWKETVEKIKSEIATMYEQSNPNTSNERPRECSTTVYNSRVDQLLKFGFVYDKENKQFHWASQKYTIGVNVIETFTPEQWETTISDLHKRWQGEQAEKKKSKPGVTYWGLEFKMTGDTKKMDRYIKRRLQLEKIGFEHDGRSSYVYSDGTLYFIIDSYAVHNRKKSKWKSMIREINEMINGKYATARPEPAQISTIGTHSGECAVSACEPPESLISVDLNYATFDDLTKALKKLSDHLRKMKP